MGGILGFGNDSKMESTVVDMVEKLAATAERSSARVTIQVAANLWQLVVLVLALVGGIYSPLNP